MNFFINPTVFTSVFTVPSDIVDKYLKLSSETQLKVLLYIMRYMTEPINPQLMSAALAIPESEVCEALIYWQQLGILNGDAAGKTETATAPIRKNSRPSRLDVAKRGLEDERVKFLMQEAQLKFGRALKSNEASSLLWLFDDCGMDVSVILMLLQYAEAEGKLNVSFIEKTAAAWIKNGVISATDAEAQIAEDARKMTSWRIAENAFGIKRRSPSPKELERVDMWLGDWGFNAEILSAAYNACVDQKSEFNFAYTAKILENWHKNGIKTLSDIEADEASRAPTNSDNGSSIDIDAFERLLDSNY